jgi:uncharacterized membrane protein/protein-disulfide isomerase
MPMRDSRIDLPAAPASISMLPWPHMRGTTMNRASAPLPFSCYFSTVALIALLGMAAAVSLSISHYRLFTDPAYSSFCAISKSINCDTVSQSPYAVLWGVPVAAWAVLGYFSVLLLLLLSRGPSAQHQRVWTLLFSLAMGFSGYSLALAAVSTFVIGSYCILCIALYAVNLLLLFFSWIVRRRFKSGPFFRALGDDLRYLSARKPVNILAIAALLAVFAGVKAGYPAYWRFHPAPLPTQIAAGVTPEGRPWIGAETPLLEIVEFADYQCFQCKKMYFHLRELIAKYPDKIRLVHVHYPMDHAVNPMVKTPFHIGSGKLALLAIHAAAEEKFWDVHELLYQWTGTRPEIDLHELASTTGLPVDGLAGAPENVRFRGKLADDIRLAMKHGVAATPSYLIGGKVYQGTIPPEAFKGIVD